MSALVESMCYLLRKTSLTRTEIGKLTPAQFNAIVKEVYYQESVDEYRRQHSVASLLAAIYNTIPRKSHKTLQARDFLGEEMPTKDGEKRLDSIDKLAKEKGIILPSN